MARAAMEEGESPGRKANYLSVLNNRGRWNGSVYMDEGAVDEPKSWQSSRVIFVNSMSDLFHDDVTDDFIKRVFATMNVCPQHVFQVLTKRPARASQISKKVEWTSNIWMGTSVEDNRVRDRISELQSVAAKTRFLSVEPLIGPVPRLPLRGIHWVIVGGESGPGARPMKIEWVRDIRDRCAVREVPFFFKQWGGVNKKATGRMLDGRTWDDMPHGINTVSGTTRDERQPSYNLAS